MSKLSKDFPVLSLAKLQRTVWSHMAFIRNDVTGAIECVPNK